jgi:predicted nucleotidyltransferase
MRRATLTRNLNELITRVRNTFLPINVLKIFVHGSYFRGDDEPGDLDIFIIANVNDQWSEWYTAFHSLSDYHDALWACYEKEMSVSEAIISIKPKINNWNIPDEWLTCISWTDIFWSFLPYMLDWNKITKKLLTRGMKGVHIEILTIDAFKQIFGRLYSYQDMPAFLVWSVDESEKSNLTPNSDEFQKYLQFENKRLLNDLNDAQLRCRFGKDIIEKMLILCPRDKLGIIALRALNNTAKYEVSEERLREELRKFGLPENLVYTLKNRGSKTWYHIAESMDEQKELEQRVKRYSIINSAEKTIVSILRECITEDEGSRIDCSITSLERGLVRVYVRKPGNITEEEFKKLWERREFRVEKEYGPMYAEKQFLLLPSSSRQEMREIIVKELSIN